MQEMKLADWLVTNKPNIVNLGCLPGGEETYVKIQDVIKQTVPGTPVRTYSPERTKDGSNMFKLEYKACGLTKNELLLSDLTILVNERGQIITLRTTNGAPTTYRFTL